MTANLTQYIWRAEQVRTHELAAAAKLNIDSYALMRRAGEALSQLTQQLIHQEPVFINTICVFVGTGNNGGDGYIAAASLHQAGLKVTVIELHPETQRTGDALKAQLNWQKLSRAEQTVPASQFVIPADSCIIDAMLGTGITRPVTGEYLACIQYINNASCPLVIAADIPSGIEANTGVPLGEAIFADHTLTFVANKPGIVTSKGKAHCGKLHLDSLGILKAFAEITAPFACKLQQEAHTLPKLPKRLTSAHKGMFGHVVVIGGNRGMSGAIRLTAATALRCGAGLVTVLTHVENQQIVASFMPELMVYGIEDPLNTKHVAEQLAKASHIIIGPGLGKDRWARQLLAQTLAHINQHNIPTVIDADALNLLAEGAAPAQLPEQCVLTPHPAEAARLLNTTTKLIEADRYDAVKRLAELYNVSALIKGAGTVIYSSTSPYTYVNSTGNPGMASAGMGDVLSGVIGALLAQQMSALDAACYGVWLHGCAGDKAAKQGAIGLIASDLLPFLRQLID